MLIYRIRMNINDKNMDGNNTKKKVKFILTWYYLERKKISDNQKIILLNRWIKSCSQFEEYEMSKALLNEKRILIRSIRLKKVGERSILKKLILLAKITIRKINRNGIRSIF